MIDYSLSHTLFLDFGPSGIDEFNNSTLPLEHQLADYIRIDYYYRHLAYLLKAIK